jgi:hypothetical protein
MVMRLEFPNVSCRVLSGMLVELQIEIVPPETTTPLALRVRPSGLNTS